MKVKLYGKIIKDNYRINFSCDNLIHEVNKRLYSNKSKDIMCKQLERLNNSLFNLNNYLTHDSYFNDGLIIYDRNIIEEFELINEINIDYYVFDKFDGYKVIESNYNTKDNCVEIKLDKIIKRYDSSNIYENDIYINLCKELYFIIKDYIYRITELIKDVENYINTYDDRMKEFNKEYDIKWIL